MLTCNRWFNTQYEKLKKLQKKFDSQYKIYIIPHKQGWLAQLVERLPYTQNVGGSIPSPPTIILLMTFLVSQ